VWPGKLRVNDPENVVVKIAANDYERLLDDIDIVGRRINKGEFTGVQN
jgi:hypothetical protein